MHFFTGLAPGEGTAAFCEGAGPVFSSTCLPL
jgi:hypothetical protein